VKRDTKIIGSNLDKEIDNIGVWNSIQIVALVLIIFHLVATNFT